MYRSHPRLRLWLSGLLALVLLLALAACAAARTPNLARDTSSAQRSEAQAPLSAPRPAAANGPAMPASDTVSKAVAAAVAPAPTPAPAGAASAPNASVPWDRMVIRNATLALTVEDVESALATVRTLTTAKEGYVLNAQTGFRGKHMVATVTVQVPAQAFDELIGQLRQIALKVDSEQTSSQDVTEEFVDLQSQLKNYHLTEASIQKLLDRAQRIEDVLALQRELSSVRGQIERIQGRLNYLQRRSDMSTISITLTPQTMAVEQPPIEAKPWDPIRTITRTWEISLRFVSGTLDVLLQAIVFCWWVPFFALGTYLVWRLIRRFGRRPTPPRTPDAT